MSCTPVLIKVLIVMILIIIYLFVFRNEEFSRPKSVRKAFEGSGQVLGSIAPQVKNSLLSHSCNLLQCCRAENISFGSDSANSHCGSGSGSSPGSE
jgi:hypothetical protein